MLFSLFIFLPLFNFLTAYCLRHFATSRKVPGSIPVVAGDFSVASDSSMRPGSTQPLKMSIRIILGVKTAGA